MILLPLPRFVGPMTEPLFRRSEAGVVEALGQVDLAAETQVLRQAREQVTEDAVLPPLLEPPMAGLLRRVAIRLDDRPLLVGQVHARPVRRVDRNRL